MEEKKLSPLKQLYASRSGDRKSVQRSGHNHWWYHYQKKHCKNHRTVSLISHPSKVMLHINHNCLKSKAEELWSEEQASSRARRTTVEQSSAVGSSVRNTCNNRGTFSTVSSFQGHIRSIMARWPLVCPRRIQDRKRVHTSHPGPLRPRHLRSSPKQPTGWVLPDKHWCQTGVHTLSDILQPVVGKNHARNPPWPHHYYLHLWQTDLQLTLCRWYRPHCRQ